MPSLKSIRRRIISVKNTQKITKAMKMVAAARLRKAEQAIKELRPYAVKTATVLGSVAGGAKAAESTEAVHPLLARRAKVENAFVVVLTSDRGLAGPFNSNAVRAGERTVSEVRDAHPDASVAVVTLGRKAREYFRRRKTTSARDFDRPFDGGPSKIAQRANEIAQYLIDEFTSQKVDLVKIVFSEFKSAISQKPVVVSVLPVEAASEAPEARATPGAATNEAGSAGKDHLYEPNRMALLEQLLPMYVAVTVQRAMLDSLASEHGARMTAMDSATKNATEMIDALTLQYNRARQASITKELMEIIGGAEALKG